MSLGLSGHGLPEGVDPVAFDGPTLSDVEMDELLITAALFEIGQERRRQISEEGYTRVDDAGHDTEDWCKLIEQRTHRIRELEFEPDDIPVDEKVMRRLEYRKRLVQIAAIACAAVEAENLRGNQKNV